MENEKHMLIKSCFKIRTAKFMKVTDFNFLVYM